MIRSGRDRGRRRVAAVKGWPLWQVPRWLVCFIVVVVAGYLATLGLAARMASLTPRGGLLLAVLLACLTATVELTRREGDSVGLTVDVYSVWELPIALLLAPFYAMAVPVFRCALSQLRIKRYAFHRRAFTASAIGLSYGAASLAFHTATHTGLAAMTSPAAHPTLWFASVALAAFTQWAVNTAVVGVPIAGSEPGLPLRAVARRFREVMFSQETFRAHSTELCVAVLVTLCIAVSPLAIVFAFPFVTLLQRSVRHQQLVSASRLDSKTGLLNAGTWEREATAEVARAVRTQTPLAVAIVDLDRFKSVNDTYGHLAGDKVLQAIAHVLKECVREYDLVGRFGGEEFALLLPQAGPVSAYSIAERIRDYIAELPIDVTPCANNGPVRVSVSIGVASLGSSWDTGAGGQLTDLLAAADMALYQAKKDGRDQVCVITENRTFGTHTQRAFVPPTA